MAIKVIKSSKERRDRGAISFPLSGGNVGETLDFMRLPEGFTITNVNVSVSEEFTNASLDVGVEKDRTRFLESVSLAELKGENMKPHYFSAPKLTSIVLELKGDKDDKGKAEVTVEYLKLPDTRQEY